MTNILKMVSPRSRESIRRDTYLLRKKLDLCHTPYFDIVYFLEVVLQKSDPTFNFLVVEDEDLAGVQAEYIPHCNTVVVKNSVYEAAISGYWWARSTLAHELGHYYYHDEHSVRYAKLEAGQKIPPDYDPERQANIFAAELLAPIYMIKGMTKERIGKDFGVSYAIATRQLSALERINRRQAQKRKEKKKRPNRSSAADRL